MNGVLAVFNLLPAAPLDGGRILAAVVWRRTGDRLRAADRASQAGQFLGWLLIAGGAICVPPAAAARSSRALLGWFLLTAARQDAVAARARAALAGVTVADVDLVRHRPGGGHHRRRHHAVGARPAWATSAWWRSSGRAAPSPASVTERQLWRVRKAR